jgi:hypothetical protein
MTLVSTFVPRKRASCKVVEAKVSFRTMMLLPVASRRMVPTRIRSSSSFPVIAARSSSCSKWVKIRSGRNRRAALPGTGQPTCGQVVELAEGAGEGGLPALVGAGHHEDPLAAVQAEVVGDHRLAPGGELARQGQVEGAGDADVLGAGGDLGVAEAQPGGPDRRDVVQVGQVELQLPVGAGDSVVEEPGVLAAVLLQGGELVREQPGHYLGDLGGDVVHPRLCAVAEQVVLGGALLEPLEGLQHRGAVVGFAFVAADLDPVAADAGAVADPPEGVLPVLVSAARTVKAGEAA